MATTGRQGLAERAFYAVCIGASGAVVVSVVSFALDLPLLATFGSPEIVITVFSAVFGLPAFWVLSRRPGASVPRRAIHAVLAALFGLVVGVLALIGLLVAGVSLPWGTAGWTVVVVGTGVVIGIPVYVLVGRGAFE